MLNKVLNKSFIKNVYSEKLITILYHMLMIDEKERFSFEELIKFIDDNYEEK